MTESLITLTQAKTRLGVTDTSEDSTIRAMSKAATSQVIAYLDYDPRLNEYTHRFDGTNKREVFLPYKPVQGVSSVIINSDTIPESTAYNEEGWYLRDQLVGLRGSRVFARGHYNCEVVFSAGYFDLPEEITESVYMALQSLYNAQTVDPNMTSESVPGVYSASYNLQAIGGLPQSVRLILEPYRKRNLA